MHTVFNVSFERPTKKQMKMFFKKFEFFPCKLTKVQLKDLQTVSLPLYFVKEKSVIPDYIEVRALLFSRPRTPPSRSSSLLRDPFCLICKGLFFSFAVLEARSETQAPPNNYC